MRHVLVMASSLLLVCLWVTLSSSNVVRPPPVLYIDGVPGNSIDRLYPFNFDVGVGGHRPGGIYVQDYSWDYAFQRQLLDATNLEAILDALTLMFLPPLDIQHREIETSKYISLVMGAFSLFLADKGDEFF